MNMTVQLSPSCLPTYAEVINKFTLWFPGTKRISYVYNSGKNYLYGKGGSFGSTYIVLLYCENHQNLHVIITMTAHLVNMLCVNTRIYCTAHIHVHVCIQALAMQYVTDLYV